MINATLEWLGTHPISVTFGSIGTGLALAWTMNYYIIKSGRDVWQDSASAGGNPPNGTGA